MPNPSFLGYLTEPYLEGQYQGDTGFHAWGMSVDRQIVDRPHALGMEVKRQILDFPVSVGAEVRRQIDAVKPVGMEVYKQTQAENPVGMEVSRQVLDLTVARGAEATLVVASSKLFDGEVARSVLNFPRAVAMEVNRQILDAGKKCGMEVRRDKSLASWLCADQGYLAEDYLENSYLAPGICAQMDGEVRRFINAFGPRGMEIRRVISATKPLGMEVRRFIQNYPSPHAMEVNRFKSLTSGMQARLVLYNTNRLRVMMDFPSRGVNGFNWTASSTAAGDFSPNNLNTDIVEEVWRSNGATSVVLTCDTQVSQGTPIDTVAFLNHNLTLSATITVEGSDNAGFSPVDETFAIPLSKQNAFYIAPTFPTIQSRYVRFFISDPTNPAGSIQIGTIVFGTTIIFQGECFTDEVRRSMRHFADKVPTEGFTNVSNDRALKTAIGLEFRMLQFAKGNYRNLRNVFETARTSLKCLWIPDPQQATRFSVFGKLVSIPDETHRNMGPDAADNVTFSVEVDESL